MGQICWAQLTLRKLALLGHPPSTRFGSGNVEKKVGFFDDLLVLHPSPRSNAPPIKQSHSSIIPNFKKHGSPSDGAPQQLHHTSVETTLDVRLCPDIINKHQVGIIQCPIINQTPKASQTIIGLGWRICARVWLI